MNFIRFTEGKVLRVLLPGTLLTALGASGLALPEVDIAQREEARAFYNSAYQSSLGVPMEWTGDYGTDRAGQTGIGYRDATLLRINYYRAMAGVPAGVGPDGELDGKAQQAAYMMSANNALSHSPPAHWRAWTAEGAEAASKSNLSLGVSGAEAVDGQMRDNGASNFAVGHRRWLLHPPTRSMGAGSVPGDGSALRPANAVWVFGLGFQGLRPATRDGYVAWPPPGYVPYPVVFPRWSFSYPGADFTNATVTLTRGGVEWPVLVEALQGAIGENTMVWVPDGVSALENTLHWPRPSGDESFTVTLRGVGVEGSMQDFSYEVILFDPESAGADTVITSLWGAVRPTRERTNRYVITAVPFAESFEWRHLDITPGPWLEGAEGSPPAVSFTTSPGYEPVRTGNAHSGQRSFHLAHPVTADQAITLLPEFLGGPGSALRFQSRLGWATPGQVALAQVSTDEGRSWKTVWSREGTGTAGQPGYESVEAPLGSLDSRTFQVRFVYRHTGGSFYPSTEAHVGWLLDQIEVEARIVSHAREPVSLGEPEFFLSPDQSTPFHLQARALAFGGFPQPWGQAMEVHPDPGAGAYFPTATQPIPGLHEVAGLGLFTADYWPWIYHFEHGFLYCGGAGGEHLFLYDLELGWLFTRHDIQPYFYSFDRQQWLAYLGRDQLWRYFFAFAQEGGETLVVPAP